MRLDLVAVCLCFMNGVLLTAGWTASDVTKTLTVANGGPWGTWGAQEFCPADDIERTVTIQLDGEEFTMEFIDALPWDDTMDHDIDLTADAYVIVYSVIDRTTFDAAVQNLYKLRHGLGSDRPVILVGNKIDLVRKRKVKKEEVQSISRTYDCLNFETSAVLNHHVDELLIVILKQIRHKLNPSQHPSPEGYIEPAMRKRNSRGASGFFVKLYRRLSRKGPRTKAK